MPPQSSFKRTSAHSDSMQVCLSHLLALQDEEVEFDILDVDNEFSQDPAAWRKKKKQRPGSSGQAIKSPGSMQRKMDGFLTSGAGPASFRPLAMSLQANDSVVPV